LEADDYEVLGLPDSSDDENEVDDEAEYSDQIESKGPRVLGRKREASQEADAERPVEELEVWGETRGDYYGADEIETEEAALEEEQEAQRTRSKQVEAITDADFDLVDPDLIQDHTGSRDTAYLASGSFAQELSGPQVSHDASPQERLSFLRERYPLFDALSSEFASLHKVFLQYKTDANEAGPVTMAKYHALGTYLGVLAMYFGLLTSTAQANGKSLAKSTEELESHPIMERIIALRETWSQVQNMKEVRIKKAEAPKFNAMDLQSTTVDKKSKPKKTKRVKFDTEAEASALRRKARMAAIEANLATLDDTSLLTRKSSHAIPNGKDTALGDEEELTQTELAEKARRKRNLGFYTSQIVQKASRRDVAGRDAGGDIDIPHRERWRDRQARLQAEAEAKRQHGSTGASNDAAGDDYQDLTMLNKAAKAEQKQKAREAWLAKEAEKTNPFEETETDGKRKLTYNIETNKGLARSRNRDSRNPRVKKRKKYEDKRKKLNSMRSVYKGGPGRGGYQGELTGIKSSIIRGTRL
jgi:U3 small nucleolar RNA-associated protein 3